MMLYLLVEGSLSDPSARAGRSVVRRTGKAARYLQPQLKVTGTCLPAFKVVSILGQLEPLADLFTSLCFSLSLSDPLSSSLFLPLTPPSLSLTNTSTHVRSLALPHHPSLPRTPIEDHSTEQHNEQPHALNGRGAVMGGC